jgi:hypothetical protein
VRLEFNRDFYINKDAVMEPLDILRMNLDLFIPLLVGIFCFRHLNIFLKLQYIFLVVGFVAMFFQLPPKIKIMSPGDCIWYYPDNQKHFAYTMPKNKWDTTIPVIIEMSTTYFLACVFVRDKKKQLLITSLFFGFIGFVLYYTVYNITSIFPTYLYGILGSLTAILIYIIMLSHCFKQFLNTGKYPPEIYLIIGAILYWSVSLPYRCLVWHAYRNDFLYDLNQHILPYTCSVLLAISFLMSYPKNIIHLFYRTRISKR